MRYEVTLVSGHDYPITYREVTAQTRDQAERKAIRQQEQATRGTRVFVALAVRKVG